jgi:hypothetical protein
MKFSMSEPEMTPFDIVVDIAQDLGSSGGKIISSYEKQEYESSKEALSLRDSAAGLDMVAKFLSLIPEMGAQAEPWGIGAAIQFGGRALSTELSLMADGDKVYADHASFSAQQSAKIDSYSRRELEWTHQSNLATGEINQIYKQLRAAEIREAIAAMELKNHQRQIQQAQEIEQFLNEEGANKTGKKTNKAFYTWMKREVKGLYAQSFQFAFDIAKKAERALQHELGNPALTFLQFDYMAGKEGLLAGEKLFLDLKQMETAYHDLNQREYEMTKHVSLLQVDPLALMKLRTTGRCSVQLPEAIFDMDGPGHYFRRIKSVALTIPCISGPYASVNCTLTLLKSTIRISSALQGNDYVREDAEDPRFSDYFGSTQSIVTSSAQNDSGLFETNLRDERYLPFENAGVVSEWQIALPADPSKNDPAQFDYNTISDVILHIRYTAREGGMLLRKGAMDAIKAQPGGRTRLFWLRYEFPSEWAKFLNQTPGKGKHYPLSIHLRKEHYPFWSQCLLKNTTRVDVIVRSIANAVPGSLDIFNIADSTHPSTKLGTLTRDTSIGNLLHGQLTVALPDKPYDIDLNLSFDSLELSDLWVAVTWQS